MAPPKNMTKTVTEKEIKSGRISLSAAVRDHLFPHVSQNSKTPATMVDENGDSYDVVSKVRRNRTKPEIMAKGGKKFLVKRGIIPGDVLLFSRGQSGDHFKVTVMREQRPASPNGFAGLLASSQPPAPPIKPTPAPPAPAMPLTSSSSVGRIKAEVQEEGVGVRPTLELTLGLGPPPTPIKPTPAPPAPAMVLISSSVGRIKAEVQEEGVGVGPTLELTLGVGPPLSLSAKFPEPAEAKSEPPEGHFLGVPVACLAADQHVYHF